MKKNAFEELVASVKEAGSIRRGEIPASRTFVYEADDIRETRRQLNQTQEEFAAMIGVSVCTLRNWEQGRRFPHGPARALLRVASRDPEAVRKALTGC